MYMLIIHICSRFFYRLGCLVFGQFAAQNVLNLGVFGMCDFLKRGTFCSFVAGTVVVECFVVGMSCL
jgi:hypothetical protein